MIELAILGLLSEQDLHGYELKKQLAELLGPWSSVSFGSLYPALARLEKAGRVKAVEAHALSDPTSPMTGALSGELAAFRTRLTGKPAKAGSKPATKPPANRRGKKVYGLTATGRERLHDLLTEEGPDDERSFGVRVAFCNQLQPAERLDLFERRRAELVAQLAARRRLTKAESRAADPATARRSDPYRRSLRERDNRTLTHDLAWLDELIAATNEAAAHELAPASAAGTDPGRPTVASPGAAASTPPSLASLAAPPPSISLASPPSAVPPAANPEKAGTHS
jgi:DNA-binding PadR family transcriptional regulator